MQAAELRVRADRLFDGGFVYVAVDALVRYLAFGRYG